MKKRRILKRVVTFILGIVMVLSAVSSTSFPRTGDGGTVHAAAPSVRYRTFVQKEGWQKQVKDGEYSGTKGKGLRMEAIRIELQNAGSSSVKYRTYVQKEGWQSYVNNGKVSGTLGQSKRLEAISIKLTGDVSKTHDIYYKVYAQKFGWLGWAKNGASSGTAGFGYRLEGIMIKLVAKGSNPPAGSKSSFENKTKKSMSDCEIDLNKSTFASLASGVIPGITVKYAGKTLSEGKDYKLALDNNVNPGYATATVSGIGDYAGAVIKSFKVVKVSSDYYDDYTRAFDMGYVASSWKSKNINESMTSREYRKMLRSMVTALAPGKLSYFDKKIKDVDVPLSRGVAASMAYYAAVCIRADNRNNSLNSNTFCVGSFWDRDEGDYNKLLPEWRTGPVQMDDEKWDDEYTASRLWNLWHDSPLSGKQVIAYDSLNGSPDMRMQDPLTVCEACCSITRLYDSNVRDEGKVSLSDSKAVTVFDECFTDKIKAKAAADDITVEELPRLTGFVLSNGYGYGFYTIKHTPNDIKRIARWGFSSVRIQCTYETLFSEDCKTVDLNQLKLLDSLVAAAVENDIHLDFSLMTIPGRNRYQGEDFESSGDFDLFTNPEKQKLCLKIWQVIAQRYKNVSNRYLSFMPFWEPDNPNLSTGAAYTEYTLDDQLATLDYLIAGIREKSPNRMIVHEVKDADGVITSKYDNILVSDNFCEMPYVYAEMTADEGADIDYHNHSMFKPEYPVTIYGARKVINPQHTMRIDGCLPKGTVIDLYLKEMKGSGTFSICSKDKVFHEETIKTKSFNTSSMLSQHYSYATSDKLISIKLDKNTDYIELKCSGGQVEWSGMSVTLPKSYEVERWYSKSGYEAYLEGSDDRQVHSELRKTSTILISPNLDDGGLNITIHDDVTYSTESVYEESNIDTIDREMYDHIKKNDRFLIRYEDACFYLGTTQKSMLRYYNDLLTTFDKYGMDWYSNDYDIILGNDNRLINADRQEYDGFVGFNLELLRLLQEHAD